MELFEKGYLTLADTDGVELRFGDAKAMVEMVRKAGEGEGFGKRLADGSYRLAESVGHPELSMSVKKQEMPAYDPRGVQGIGLNYATNNRGGCHVRGYTIAVEVLGNGANLDPRVTEEKAATDMVFQNLTAALDSSGACLFSTFGIGGAELAEMLSALTGVTYTVEEFLKIGERIWNNERMWNLDNGYTADDDTLPSRLLEEPIKTGPAKGEVNRLGEMLPEYYSLRGWDENGVPTAEKLEELSL
jgi:aldehyde:ferredoxin oxidoreductase